MIIIVKLYVMRMIVDQREKTCNVMTMDDTEKDFSLTYILQLHLPFKLCLLGTHLYVFLNIYVNITIIWYRHLLKYSYHYY